MTATVLVKGTLFGDAKPKTSRNLKSYVTATLRCGSGDTVQWWSVVCFSESACEELLELRDGDGLAVSGSFRAEIYERNGSARISLTCIADRLISAKRAKREKTAERRTESRQGPIDSTEAQRPFDDPLPDGWLP